MQFCTSVLWEFLCAKAHDGVSFTVRFADKLFYATETLGSNEGVENKAISLPRAFKNLTIINETLEKYYGNVCASVRTIKELFE